MASADLLNAKHIITEQDKKARMKEKIVQHASDHGLLVVKVDSTGEGVLTERQKKWLNTTPFDRTTENPVVYKLAVESLKPSKEIIEREQARYEVQSLSDRPTTQQGTSRVAQRITESRRERHEQTTKDMQEELSAIKNELEVKIQRASELFKSQLTANDILVESLFARIGSAKLLENYTLEQLHLLWSEVSSQSPLRRQQIKALDATLSGIEEERQQLVTEVLKSYAHMLHTIAFLLPDDVQRLIDEEAHDINVAMLANRKTYSQLCINLMTADFSREKEQRRKWETTVHEWKELVCKLTRDDFTSFMESEEILRPAEMESLKELLSAEQAAVQRRRMDLLQQMAELRPPRATKTIVYEWGESMEKLHQQLEHIHCTYLLKFQSCQETVNRACENKMESCRKYLVSSRAFDTENVYRVMTQQFMPLVEQQNEKAKIELQSVEKSLDLLMSSQKTQIQSVFQYAQGAAHLWDTHTTAMEQLERNFQEELDKCRSCHDNENQNLEANLDVVLDRLRQGASQEMLTQYLSEALKMLDTIKVGYTSFHIAMLEEIEKYPTLIQQEMDSYDTALCQYLGVGRSLPKKKKSKSQLTRTSSEMLKSESRSASRKSLKPSRAKTMASLAQNRQDSVGSSKGGTAGGLTDIVAEVISTSQGTNFYLSTTTSQSSLSDGQGTFLTQDEESEGSVQPFATEKIMISEEMFTMIRNGLCVSFLDHMEQQKRDALKRAQEIVDGKKEEARTELDLRLHLHLPRPSRIEQDIHNVRAAELVAHRDRVASHAQSVVASLNHHRSLVQMLVDKLQPEADRFVEEIASLESSLCLMKNTSGLLKLQSQAKGILHHHLAQLDLLSSEHLDSSDHHLRQLRDSNDSFKVSLRLFSEGGNYCPEEIELFTKKMDKLSSKISNTQSFIGREVATTTDTQKANGNETHEMFDTKFQIHFADMSFLEEVSRTLTSTQVKIKSEVATSNTQSRELFDLINKIRKMITEAQKQNHSPSTVLSELPSLFEVLKSRADYLYCYAHKLRGTRVGGHPDAPPTPSHFASKVQGPISAVNVTKSILRSATVSDGKHFKPAAGTATRVGSHSDLKGSPSHEELLHKKSDGRHSRRKTVAVERKNVHFGIGGGEDGSISFLPQIRAILKTTHAQLYKTTEAYYKSKGSRPPTCPDEIHETFDLFIDSLIEKCQRYRDQAEEYRNNCIEEFRSQLESVMSLLEEVPGLVFSEITDHHREKTTKERDSKRDEHSTQMRETKESKLSHESSLRPGLGHPSKQEELVSLCGEEEERHSNTLKTIHEHAHSVKECEKQFLVQFVKVLMETTNTLLSLFDKSTNSSDIIKGSTQHTQLPIEHLLREHIGQQTTSETTGREDSLRTVAVTLHKGLQVWPGLPAQEMKLVWDILPPPPTATGVGRKSVNHKSKRPSSRIVVSVTEASSGVGESSSGQDKELSALSGALMEKVTSKKHTDAHEAVVIRRDAVFKEYIVGHQRVMEEIKKREDEESNSEEKWFTNWRTSVERIKQLYS